MSKSFWVIPWIAAVILKSRLNSAGTLKFMSTVLPGSGLFKLERVSVVLGGSPFLLVVSGFPFPFLGGGGGFVAI